MVHTCVAVGCHNRSNPGSSLPFYRFPAEPERRRRWITAVKREGWHPNEHSRLCGEHFLAGHQSKNPLSPDYVPSVFKDSPSRIKRRKKNSLLKFHQRGDMKKRKQEQVDLKLACSALLDLHEHTNAQDSSVNLLDTETTLSNKEDYPAPNNTTSITSQIANPIIPDYKADCLALRLENQRLREKLDLLSFDRSAFEKDPQKVEFYTGLPNYTTFSTVLWLISNDIKTERHGKLSQFHQLLLTLMKLRLDLKDLDLAYRFGVHTSTVSRTFQHVINLLFVHLVPMVIFWPARETLRKTMPLSFCSTYPDCVVIVDCFEVLLENSSDQEASSTTHCTSRNTLKYLIGIAPQGVITFISKGWNGCVSDKHLTENCGFFKKLLPGDVVLAERGFDIQESVAMEGAKLEILASAKGKSQLCQTELECSHELVRIHVERVIGMVRQKFAMLNGPVGIPFTDLDPSSNLITFDKIVHVSCALNNLCESVVPFD